MVWWILVGLSALQAWLASNARACSPKNVPMAFFPGWVNVSLMSQILQFQTLLHLAQVLQDPALQVQQLPQLLQLQQLSWPAEMVWCWKMEMRMVRSRKVPQQMMLIWKMLTQATERVIWQGWSTTYGISSMRLLQMNCGKTRMRFKSQSKQFWIEPVPIQNSPWNLLSVFVLRFKDSGEGQHIVVSVCWLKCIVSMQKISMHTCEVSCANFLGWFADEECQLMVRDCKGVQVLPKPDGHAGQCQNPMFFQSKMDNTFQDGSSFSYPQNSEGNLETKWLSTWKSRQWFEFLSNPWGGVREISTCAHSHVCMTVYMDSAQGWHAQIENHSVAVSLTWKIIPWIPGPFQGSKVRSCTAPVFFA